MIPQRPRSTLFPYTTLFRSKLDNLSADALWLALRVQRKLGDRSMEASLVAQLRRRSEEHTSELQSRRDLVCRLLLEKKNEVISRTAEHRDEAHTPSLPSRPH